MDPGGATPLREHKPQPGTLQDLKTRQRIHRRLVRWKNNKQLPGCPGALARGQKYHVTCLMLLSAVKWDNSKAQHAQQSCGGSVWGMQEAAWPAQLEHQGGLGSNKH